MEQFSSRVVEVFAGLDQPQLDARPSWCVSASAVEVSGRSDDGVSSDDEASAEHRECVEVFQGCQSDEEEACIGLLPSASACKAFKAEEEEDEFDRLATESLSRLGCQTSLKPALKTQVAELNVHDRAVMRFGGASEPASASPRSGSETTSEAGRGRQLGSAKRVRFREGESKAEFATALSSPRKAGTGRSLSTRVSSCGDLCSPWDHSNLMPDLLTKRHKADSAAPSGDSLSSGTITDASLTRVAGSYVPDHVRNPSKYTCYTLDEPLLVGGGDHSHDPPPAGPASITQLQISHSDPGAAAAAPSAGLAADSDSEMDGDSITDVTASPMRFSLRTSACRNASAGEWGTGAVQSPDVGMGWPKPTRPPSARGLSGGPLSIEDEGTCSPTGASSTSGSPLAAGQSARSRFDGASSMSSGAFRLRQSQHKFRARRPVGAADCNETPEEGADQELIRKGPSGAEDSMDLY